MKHLLILLITLNTLPAFSQSSTPRTGVGVFHDNTFRALTLKYVPVTNLRGDGTDTVNLRPNAYKTLVSVPALTGTLTVAFPSAAVGLQTCYLGDEITITAIGSGALSFIGGSVVTSNSYGATLSVSTRATITFVFDGTTWFEEYRQAQ